MRTLGAAERGLGDSDEESGEDSELSWRAAVCSLLWSVYVPGTVRALGQQSLDPFVPLFAQRMGATVSEAGVVSSISFAANALCSPVAGIRVAGTGENCAMLLGVAINIGAAVLGGLAPSVFGLSVSRGLTGAGNGIFQVGRQASARHSEPGTRSLVFCGRADSVPASRIARCRSRTMCPMHSATACSRCRG